MKQTMIDRMDNWLAEVNTAIKSQKEKDNTFTVCVLQEAREIIRHYYNLSKQGRLVELPCAVGDTVYIPYLSKVIEKQVFSIVVQKAFYTVYCDGTSLRFSEEDFGKTIFLTRKEAEAKLAEKGGTNDE